MQAAITELEIALGTMENNAPINEAEGKFDQAALERTNAEDFKQALSFLRLAENNTLLPSKYRVGQAVMLNLGNASGAHAGRVPAFIRAIIFSSCKVRYSLWVPSMETTLHNIDSFFVEDSTDVTTKDFGEDNYS